MPTPSKFANILHGFCLYVFWTWVPATAVFFADYWLLRRLHFHVFPNLPLIVLASGIFAPGAAAYLAIRSGGETIRTRIQYHWHGMFIVLKVLAAEVASAILFCVGIAIAGVFLDGGDRQGELVTVTVMYAMALLVVSLFTGIISCTVGCVAGTTMGASLQNDSQPQESLGTKQPGWSISGTMLSFAVFTALDIAALLWALYANTGRVAPSPNARMQFSTVAWVLLWLVLVGNLWACVVVLGMWCFPPVSDRRKWIVLVLLFGLVAFGLWSVHFCDYPLWFSTQHFFVRNG